MRIIRFAGICVVLGWMVVFLGGCLVCTYDTFSKPKVVGSASIKNYLGKESDVIYLQYDGFSMGVHMDNLIHESDALVILPPLPILIPAKKAPNSDRIRVWLYFRSDEGRTELKDSSVGIKSNDIFLRRNDTESYPAKSIEVFGLDVASFVNGTILAYDNARAAIYFDLVWNPKDKYELSIKEMTFKESTIIPPTLGFSKSRRVRKCDVPL